MVFFTSFKFELLFILMGALLAPENTLTGGQTGEDVDLNSTCIFHGFHIYLINRIPQKIFGQPLIFLFLNSKFKYLLIIFGMNSLV